MRHLDNCFSLMAHLARVSPRYGAQVSARTSLKNASLAVPSGSLEKYNVDLLHPLMLSLC